jgi:hypothetical protein
LTEAIAFVRALSYNPGKKITTAQIAEIEKSIGDDYYEVSQSGIDSAIDLLSGIYGLDDVKAKL